MGHDLQDCMVISASGKHEPGLVSPAQILGKHPLCHSLDTLLLDQIAIAFFKQRVDIH